MNDFLHGYLENENEGPLEEDDFVFDVDPLHHRRIHIDLQNLAERPNEAGDRMVPLNLMEDDNALFNMLQFDFSFADAATNSGDMPQDFLEQDEIEGLTIKKNFSKKKVRQCKRRSRTTISTSSDNFRIPIKNSFRSKSCLRKQLLTYSAQSDVHIRINDHQ